VAIAASTERLERLLQEARKEEAQLNMILEMKRMKRRLLKAKAYPQSSEQTP
jgi:hypothetical protein